MFSPETGVKLWFGCKAARYKAVGNYQLIIY